MHKLHLSAPHCRTLCERVKRWTALATDAEIEIPRDAEPRESRAEKQRVAADAVDRTCLPVPEAAGRVEGAT